jgi:PAS domain S-box-containing protein
MFWLYLLAIVTFLIIILRRVLRRQKPLSDELYEKKVAIDNVRTGVAWVPEEGKLGWLNPALPEVLQIGPKHLIGRDWYELFAPDEREGMREAYRQMLLTGSASRKARALRTDGVLSRLDVLLIAVHDHRTRFVGHHCLIEDHTREHELEQQLRNVNTHAPVL